MLTTYPFASIDIFIVAWRNSIGSKVGARRLSQVKPWLGPVIDRLGERLACAADQCLAAEALGSARLLPSRGGSTTKGGAICRCRAGRRTGDRTGRGKALAGLGCLAFVFTILWAFTPNQSISGPAPQRWRLLLAYTFQTLEDGKASSCGTPALES